MQTVLKMMLLSILWFLNLLLFFFYISCLLHFMVYGKEQFQGYIPVTVSAEMKIPMLFVNTMEREAKLCFGVGVESLLVSPAKFTGKSEELCLVCTRKFDCLELTSFCSPSLPHPSCPLNQNSALKILS